MTDLRGKVALITGSLMAIVTGTWLAYQLDEELAGMLALF